MQARILAAAVAFALAGFAPLPFLVKPKKEESSRLEGLWHVIASGPGGKGAQRTHIRIEPEKWSFYNDNPDTTPQRPVSYHLKRKPGVPMGIELRRNAGDGAAYGKGVLQVTGDEMRLSYGWGEGLAAPTGFEPPKSGSINFTLRRVK